MIKITYKEFKKTISEAMKSDEASNIDLQLEALQTELFGFGKKEQTPQEKQLAIDTSGVKKMAQGLKNSADELMDAERVKTPKGLVAPIDDVLKYLVIIAKLSGKVELAKDLFAARSKLTSR